MKQAVNEGHAYIEGLVAYLGLGCPYIYHTQTPAKLLSLQTDHKVVDI